LKKKSVYEELDDEIPNDEQINEMLARNEVRKKQINNIKKKPIKKMLFYLLKNP
jgi:hypothetical protein